MQLLRKIFVLLMIFVGLTLFSQEAYTQSRKAEKAQKKAEKQKEAQKAAYEKAKKKDVQHRVDIQSAETKKRMKQSRKQADLNNDRYHVPFYKRIFRRTH
jgi:hypothetical protein